MRKVILYPALLVMLLISSAVSYSQLVIGDIAFTGYNADGTDAFSFVVLRPGGIAAGTQITFTNRGFQSGTCAAPTWAATVEQEVTWTATSALAYGAQVAIDNTLTANTGTVTGTALVNGAAGGQIFAYQGTQAAPTFLAGIHMNEEPGVTGTFNWDNQVAPTASQSNRPPCLTNGTYALFINPEVDNARIKSSVVLTGDQATDLARINNSANWDVDDVTPFPLPGAVSGLPVDFTWVKATEKGGRVQIDWGVGTEEEIIDYTIERSSDGRSYKTVGSVPATGKRTYGWSDAQPIDGNNFYRIRATELSSHTKYSTIAIINLSKNGKGIGVYPSLVTNNRFTLQITNLPAGNYKLNLHNSMGQLVDTRVINHAGGSATQIVTLPASLQKGIYRLNMRAGDENVVTTVVVE